MACGGVNRAFSLSDPSASTQPHSRLPEGGAHPCHQRRQPGDETRVHCFRADANGPGLKKIPS